jgi:hypothetical protein
LVHAIEKTYAPLAISKRARDVKQPDNNKSTDFLVSNSIDALSNLYYDGYS